MVPTIDKMIVNADVVQLAFMFILGRHVESAEVVKAHLATIDVANLRRALLLSDEFRNLYLDILREK